MPDEDIRKSKLLYEGTTTLPKDSEGVIQPADRDTTITIPKDGIEKHPLVPKGIPGDKDSVGKYHPLIWNPNPLMEVHTTWELALRTRHIKPSLLD